VALGTPLSAATDSDDQPGDQLGSVRSEPCVRSGECALVCKMLNDLDKLIERLLRLGHFAWKLCLLNNKLTVLLVSLLAIDLNAPAS
jgi:hypothetical protein